MPQWIQQETLAKRSNALARFGASNEMLILGQQSDITQGTIVITADLHDSTSASSYKVSLTQIMESSFQV
jgi:hypothetical protein